MKIRTLLRTLAACLAATWLPLAAQIAAVENLIPEGYLIGNIGDPPRGWNVPHPNYLQTIGATIALEKSTEDAGNFVTVTNAQKNKLVRMQTQLEVDPTWVGRTMTFRARMRGVDIRPGDESWHLGGLMAYITKKDGKISYGAARLTVDVPIAQWRRFSGSWVVSEEAKILHIDVGVMGSTGTLQVRDIEVFLE